MKTDIANQLCANGCVSEDDHHNTIDSNSSIKRIHRSGENITNLSTFDQTLKNKSKNNQILSKVNTQRERITINTNFLAKSELKPLPQSFDVIPDGWVLATPT